MPEPAPVTIAARPAWDHVVAVIRLLLGINLPQRRTAPP
jgi:hypothetical protein